MLWLFWLLLLQAPQDNSTMAGRAAKNAEPGAKYQCELRGQDLNVLEGDLDSLSLKVWPLLPFYIFAPRCDPPPHWSTVHQDLQSVVCTPDRVTIIRMAMIRRPAQKFAMPRGAYGQLPFNHRHHHPIPHSTRCTQDAPQHVPQRFNGWSAMLVRPCFRCTGLHHSCEVCPPPSLS